MCCVANDIITNPFLSLHFNLFLLFQMFLQNYCIGLLTDVALTACWNGLNSSKIGFDTKTTPQQTPPPHPGKKKKNWDQGVNDPEISEPELSPVLVSSIYSFSCVI